MRIFDSRNNLIAMVIRNKTNKFSKTFYSEQEDELQVGKFKLKKNEEIIRHFHPENKRSINNTTEVLIVLKGKLKVNLFDNLKKFLQEIEIYEEDILVLFSGGHQILVLEDCEFIEVKQGPYNEYKDKVRF